MDNHDNEMILPSTSDTPTMTSEAVTKEEGEEEKAEKSLDPVSNSMEITSLVKKASDELADAYRVDQIASPLLDHVQQQGTQCLKGIQDIRQTTLQAETNTQTAREALASLRSQSEHLQQAFDSIDQLEAVVQQMNKTLQQVTNNVDEMEKAVQTSTQKSSSLPIPFRFSKQRSDSPVQPYFPPPHTVDIPSSQQLLSHINDL